MLVVSLLQVVPASTAGAAGTGAAAGPSGTAAAPAAGDYTPPPIDWRACQHPRLVEAGARCGFVEVPLYYADPSGTKIQLAVSRVPHKTPDSQAQGPMLVNPGGPGGSGLVYAILGGLVPDGGGDSYDWIGFDPRGVGSSRPALSCIPDYSGYNRPYYVPITPQLEQTWLQRAESYAKACDRTQHELLAHLKTVDSARDMDSIRKALGAPQINYYGYSYGTYIGQVYGTLFPDRLRRMVLDSNVHQKWVWYEGNLEQSLAFDRNLKIFFDWVARHDTVYGLGTTGPDVERLFYSEQAELLGQPAGGIIGPDEWTDLFARAAYFVDGWPVVADAFAGWVHNGDWQALQDLYGHPPFNDNGYAIYLAVLCTDVQWPLDWDKWRRDNWRIYLKAPYATWGNAWGNAPCVFWGAEAGTPVRVDGRKVRSALLINETLDAATPIEGAFEARRLFPNSVLIEGVGGTTHSGSLSGVACTDGRIVAYLKTGALPARKPGNNRSDVQCPPVPQPTPTTSTPPASALGELWFHMWN